MRYLVNGREMRLYDSNTSERLKVPPFLLMEQAALAACDEIEKMSNKTAPILIVCGTGNNGGDGLAIGRILFLRGYCVELVLLGNIEKATEANVKQQEILQAYGVELLKEIPINKRYQLVIDAIFGVGLTRSIEGIYKHNIEIMNGMDACKVALDIPSGVSADNGAVLGVAFRADKTITFAFDKVGLHLWPGNELTGEIVVKEIGITKQSFFGQEPQVMALEDGDLEQLNIRPSHANKGTFGKLLVIAGSVNMAGAAILAGKSAYAAGCGLVRIFTPKENREIIQISVPEAILTTYTEKKVDTEAIKDAVMWADAILIGPGLGTGVTSEVILKQILKEANVPVVMDADALNILSKDMGILDDVQTEMIVTPHLGEMSRLTGKDVVQLQANLVEAARTFSEFYGVTCVLKDERTVISVPAGKNYLNLSGNSGMATAGSGDVLAGMVGSLLAQGYENEKAASLAVYLHGVAGDHMIQETGKAGLTATDLIVGIRRFFGCKESKNGIL